MKSIDEIAWLMVAAVCFTAAWGGAHPDDLVTHAIVRCWFAWLGLTVLWAIFWRSP